MPDTPVTYQTLTVDAGVARGLAGSDLADAVLGEYTDQVISDDRVAAARAELSNMLLSDHRTEGAGLADLLTGYSSPEALYDALVANANTAVNVKQALTYLFLSNLAAERINRDGGRYTLAYERWQQKLFGVLRTIRSTAPYLLSAASAPESSTSGGGALVSDYYSDYQ